MPSPRTPITYSGRAWIPPAAGIGAPELTRREGAADPPGRGKGLPFEALHDALDTPEKLAHGGAVGCDGMPVGVRDPLLARDSARVLRQGVELVIQKAPEAFIKRRDVARAHSEHEVGLLEHRPAHLPGALILRVDPDLLERRERVRGHGVALKRRDPCALGPEGEPPVLGEGVEYRRGHGAAADTGGADENDLLHAFFSYLRGASGSNVDGRRHLNRGLYTQGYYPRNLGIR